MRKATFRALIVACFVFGLSAIGATSPVSARTYVPSFATVKKDKGPVFRQGCLVFTQRVTSPPCHYGEVGSKKKFTVLGDSHALQWTPALIDIAKDRGWEMTALLRKNCTAAQVNVSPVCNRWRHNALKRIRVERPKMVIVASNTAENTFVVRNGKRLSRAASEPIFRAGMYKTLLMLRKWGIKVTLIRDLPMSRDFLPPVCVSQNRNHPGRCAFPALRPLSEAYDFAAAKRLKAVHIIDPLPKVCPGGRMCRAVHGNVLKYRDRGHLSATFCRLLTGWLARRIPDPFVR